MTDDRIKLAEAMGWKRLNKTEWLDPDGIRHTNFGFNPFTDANDDYAVLEWMRKNETMPMSLCGKLAFHYKVGDYARAALKVLEQESRNDD